MFDNNLNTDSPEITNHFDSFSSLNNSPVRTEGSLTSNTLNFSERIQNLIKVDEAHQFLQTIPCQKSLFIFSQDNLIRKAACKLAYNKYFNFLMNFSVVAYASASVLYTFCDLNDCRTDPWAYPSLLMIKIVANVVISLEVLSKILVHGLIINQESFLTKKFNVLSLLFVAFNCVDIMNLAGIFSISDEFLFKVTYSLTSYSFI